MFGKRYLCCGFFCTAVPCERCCLQSGRIRFDVSQTCSAFFQGRWTGRPQEDPGARSANQPLPAQSILLAGGSFPEGETSEHEVPETPASDQQPQEVRLMPWARVLPWTLVLRFAGRGGEDPRRSRPGVILALLPESLKPRTNSACSCRSCAATLLWNRPGASP